VKNRKAFSQNKIVHKLFKSLQFYTFGAVIAKPMQ